MLRCLEWSTFLGQVLMSTLNIYVAKNLHIPCTMMQLSKAHSTIELLPIVHASFVVRPAVVLRAKEHSSLTFFIQDERRNKWALISLFQLGVISSWT
jgi:hypothetical protein